MNRTKSFESDGRSSGYDSGRDLISPDEEPQNHKDKIGKMSQQAFQTTDFRAIAGQESKVKNMS